MTRRVIFVPDDYWTDPPQENHMNDEHDLADGFPQYQRPPRDTVPAATAPANAALIPVGHTTVTSYEMTDSGVTRTDEKVFVGRPITRETLRNRKENPND